METILNLFGLSYAKLIAYGAVALTLVGLGVSVYTLNLKNENLKLTNAQYKTAIEGRDNIISKMKVDAADLQAGLTAYIKKQQDDQTIKDYLNNKLSDTTALIEDFEKAPTKEKVAPLQKSLSDTYNQTNDCISYESGKSFVSNPCATSR
jgi:hypothetical protein